MKQNSLSRSIKKVTPVVLIDEDEQKKNNFNLIGKMFGNLTQSINVNHMNNNNKNNLTNNLANNNNNNSSSLLNNNNTKFTGGFKQPVSSQKIKNNITSQTSNLIQKNKNKQQINKQIDIHTVYDQFGLINDSIGKQNYSNSKPKYRQYPNQSINNNHNNNNSNTLSSNQYRIQQSSLINEMKNNRKQQFNQVINNNYVNLHQYYDIAKQKDRQQTVSHVKSSLDNMTLQNVQAKLQAHRRQLKQIQSQYQNKKGIIIQSNQQLHNNNQSYLANKTFTKTGQNDPYKQYGKTQSQIYQLIKNNQKDDQNQLVINQMWQQKLKQNPKLLQYSKKYQQYLVQKDAKNILYNTVRQNLFKWDKYKKSTLNQKSLSKINKKSLSKQKSISKLNKSLEKYQHQASLEKSQLISTNIHQVLASKDDKFIAKYIFAQVDVDKKGLLSKQQLLDYITKNQHIIKSYNIDMKWIYTDLDNYDTKRKGMLNKQQLGIFLATFQRTFHPEIKLTDISQLSKSKSSLLNDSKPVAKHSPFEIYFATDLYIFRDLFEKLDLNQDKILKRQQYIQNIYIDSQCCKIIDKVVIRIKIIQKDITYRQIISFILDDYRKQKNQKLKKSKQYITFNRFCQYFQFPQSINIKSIKKKYHSDNSYITNQILIYDLEQENILILKDIFDTIPRVYQDFIVTNDFIQTALIDPQVLAFQQDMSRIQSVQTNLPIQTVRLTLQRMIKQTDQYIDWDTVKSFFSRRGRPLQWNQALIKQKKTIRQQQRAKSINQTLKRQLILKNQLQVSAKLKSQYQNQQKRNSQNNFTIPQPFKITDEIKEKQSRQKFDKTQAEFKSVAKQMAKTSNFKAKGVNKQILGSKPDLVKGKRPASSAKQIPEYKYENYENDRIERALKKAQQKYQFEQKDRQIKQLAKVKANKVGVDLTKNWLQVMKADKKNVKLNEKKPLTQIQKSINERLYPTSQDNQEKMKKLQQKKQKQDQIQRINKQKKNQQIKANQQLIKKTIQQGQKVKKQKQKNQKQRQKLAVTSQQTFNPKITTNKQLSQAQKKAIQQGKKQRSLRQMAKIWASIQNKQKQRKKILQRQLKDPYLKINELKNNQDIIENIYSINIFDILLDNQQKQQFQRDHDFQNKNKKQRQIYLKGMACKFKIIMEREQKVLQQLKIINTQNKQLKNIKKVQEKAARIAPKGKSDKMKDAMNFHGSKALQRYRKIIDGTAPSKVPSQYDRFEEQNFYEKDNNKKKGGLQEVSEEQKD